MCGFLQNTRMFVCFLFLVSLRLPVASGSPNTCTFKPPKVGVVQGIVIDASHSPIKGTFVRLWSDGYRTSLVFEGKTDELGRFRLPEVKPGSYYLEFQAPEFRDSQIQLRVSRYSSKNSGLIITPSFSRMGCADRIEKRRLLPNERLPEI